MADADVDHAKNVLKLAYITCLIIVGVLVLFLLHVLGSLRRRSSSKFLHIVVLTAYTFSYALVSYTLGLMQESSYYFNEFSVWAVCLLMLLGGTDNLMAYELNDVDNWKSYHVKHLFQGVLVVYIVAAYTNSDDARQYRSPLWAILFVNGLQSFVRSKSMMMASKSNLLCKNVKPIVEYMKLEINQQLPSDATMKGCRYIVAGEQELGKQPVGVENMKITTVGKVWQSEGSLLCSNSKRSKRLMDICLSMALSKMLNRRFVGFKIDEAELANACDFVFKGLLSGDGDEPCERAFRVIEVELGFVYDLYYTRYPYLYHKVRHFALCLPVAMVIFCSWLTYVLFKEHKEAVGQKSISLSTTLFLMAVVTFLEAFQLYLHLASDWFKVALIRSYVTRPALQRSRCFGVRVINLLLRLPAFRPWEKKLGQYSLLENYNRTSRARTFWHYVTLWLVDKQQKGCKGTKLVELSKQVKEAVIGSLVRSKDDDLKKVVRSPTPRIHTELSWAFGGTVTQNILVWHIATTICKYHLDAALAKQHGKQILALSAEDSSAVDTASSLSQYCAYLIAFVPDLLPDHSFDSAYELEKSIKEAGVLLGDAKTMEAKCKELIELSIKVTNTAGAPIDLKGIEVANIASAPLVVKGARLASQLMEDIQDRSMQWKILSDFWADMVLYIAPCDDAQCRAHLEALARGGEFITHLWALLTHAGILKRAPNEPEVV